MYKTHLILSKKEKHRSHKVTSVDDDLGFANCPAIRPTLITGREPPKVNMRAI